MTGAGTLIAANHLANKGVADGTQVAMFTAQVAVDPFLGNKSATFDPLKLGWVGSIVQNQQFCAVTPGPGVPTTFQELTQKEAVFGSSASGSDIFRLISIMKNVLGAKIRMVTGYSGMPAVTLAVQRGEVSGTCGYSTTALRTHLAPSLANGSVKLLVQMGRSPTAEFGPVPTVLDLAPSGEKKELLDFLFNTLAIGRVIAAPPGVPAERLAALRAAFVAAFKDNEFLDEAKKRNMVTDHVAGADVEAQIARVSKYPPEFFKRVQAAYE